MKLRRAGWIVMVALGAAAVSIRAQELAITFDDLPVHGPLPAHETRMDVAKKILTALDREHVPPVYGFVNAQWIETEPDTVGVLAEWRKAGNPLGSHTWSHMNLNRHSLDQFQEDIAKDEPVLKLQMAGQDWHWFRFPFLAEGDTDQKRMGVRVYLAEHEYRIAGVTMSFADYAWNEPYARCEAKHDGAAVARLEHSYLKAAEESIGYSRGMAKTLYGRDIPYVLLMHIGAFDARMLPRLLRLYRKRGFRFVTLEEAEKDPFYRYDTDPKLLPGPDTLEGAMDAKHLPLPSRATPIVNLETICK